MNSKAPTTSTAHRMTPDAFPDARAILPLLAEVQNREFPPGPVSIAELAQLTGQPLSECTDAIRQLRAADFVETREARSGAVCGLTAAGRRAAEEQRVVAPLGPDPAFSDGILPLNRHVIDAVIEQEIRIGGAAISREGVAAAVSALHPDTSMANVDSAIAATIGRWLTSSSGYLAPTLPGVMASKWGRNAAEIIRATIAFLRNRSPTSVYEGVVRWTDLRTAMQVPHGHLNLVNLVLVLSGLVQLGHRLGIDKTWPVSRHVRLPDTDDPVAWANQMAQVDSSGAPPARPQQPEATPSSVAELWNKTHRRIDAGDLEGAITTATSTLEDACLQVIKGKSTSGLDRAWKEATKRVCEELPSEMADRVQNLLSGCRTAVNGLASVRNHFGDAHGGGSKLQASERHYADLVVNIAFTMTGFVLDFARSGGIERPTSDSE